MTKTAIHFGAGNIGRGFIGPMLMNSDYKVVFVDVVDALIENVQTFDSYDLHILAADGKQVVSYKRGQYEGINSKNDLQGLSDQVVKADLITTSVGPNVLRFVAKDLAVGLKRRMTENPSQTLNVIACENLINNSGILKGHVETHMSSEEEKKYLHDVVGFPNCAVDRIVPPIDQSKFKGLDVPVEQFCEWDVDSKGVKGELGIKDLVLTADLNAYVERKLFTVNTSHCVIAYLGYLKGYKYVHESIADEEIYRVARGAVEESGAALIKRHSKDFNKEDHAKYIDKILEQRMKNPNLIDEVYRVGRDPKRKLGRSDRLVGPAAIAIEHDLPTDNLTKGIAAALLFDYPEDETAKEIQATIKEKGVEEALIHYSGLHKQGKHADLIDKAIEYYNEYKTKYNK